MQPQTEFVIGEEIVTHAELNRRRAENRHELEVTAASFETGALLTCPKCDVSYMVDMADNGNLDMSTMRRFTHGDPFASHSYCSGGCKITGVEVSQ